MDIDSLSPSQKNALDQLQALTNGGDPDVAIGVLSSVDWDVQRAADVIFDSGSPVPPPMPSSRPPQMDLFEVDDSEQGLLRDRPSGGREFRRVTPPSSSSTLITRPLRVIVSFLAIPLQFLSQLLRFIFRILHIPLPNVSSLSFSSLNFYRRVGDGRAMDARSVAERWVRALEEETGAVCVGNKGRRRAEESSGIDAGVASGVAGPSTLTARAPAWSEDADVKLLPNFFLGGYEEFARTCLRDIKIGCVVLVSEEHDDVAEFKRSTLTDPSFVTVIQENDILVWGGDIRDREAWSASQKLQATTYPFVAFIAIQPRRGLSSSSSPTLTILSRHQGPAIPSHSGPTSASTLTSHLTTTLLPRLVPFFERQRAQAEEEERAKKELADWREREWALRAEQDRAFEDSRRKDMEKRMKREEEERLAEVERRQREEEERREKERREREERERMEREERRMEWRKWGRRALVLREPRPGEGRSPVRGGVSPSRGSPSPNGSVNGNGNGRGRTLRVVVRMPDGRRAVRFFGDADGLVALFAFVDSLFIPSNFSSDDDPLSPPSSPSLSPPAQGQGQGEDLVMQEMSRLRQSPEEWWGFKLWLQYPRREIPWAASQRIGDVDILKGGGQLVVELYPDASVTKAKQSQGVSAKTNGADSDGYETESE